MNLTFFLGSECLGSMPASPLTDPGAGNSQPIYRKDHTALCCPLCGEIWGRIVTDKSSGHWTFAHRTCRKCDLRDGSPWMMQAGSFLDPLWWRSDLLITNPALPDAVVRWEFAGIIPFIEKELQSERNS